MTPVRRKGARLDLTEAARRAGVRYSRMRDLVLVGRVEGWREHGRWYVAPASLTLFLRETSRDLA